MAVDSITDFERTDDSGQMAPGSSREPTGIVETPEPVAAESPEPSPDPEPEPEPETDETLARDGKGRFRKTRHSAKHDARPEDVPRIQEFSRALKAAEDKLMAEIEALKKGSAPKAPSLPSSEVTIPAPGNFAEPEPTLDQFLDKPDPYGALLRAQGQWDRRKELFDWQQAQQKNQVEQSAQQQQQQWEQLGATYKGRVQEFVKTHPDFVTKLEPLGNQPIPPVIQAAIYLDDNGPELVYKMLDRPDVLAAAHLLGEGRPVTNETVASARAWLRGQLSAGGTGSAPLPTTPVTIGPRPPNPVRTGPLNLGDETSTEAESLDEHMADHAKARRRR